MNRREFLGYTTGAALGMALRSARAAVKPWNVLFIMSDQHNARALGCYGNAEIRTPNMDRLAASGALFKRALCQTGQCVPSRFSIFTGRYARSTGTYGNGNGQKTEEQTVADLFGAAGYATATFGKHHMLMTKANHNHGFDVVEEPAVRAEYTNPLPYDEVHPGRAKVGESPLPNDKHFAGIITKATLDFIEAHKDSPFVVWQSFHGPHTPINPSKPWSEWYDPDKLTLPPSVHQRDGAMPGVEGLLSKSGTYPNEDYHRKTLAFYYGHVSQIDYNIGRVLDKLDELGLADHTLVFYTADHGEMLGEHGAWTKGLTGYEATIRVPLLLRAPGVVPAGARVEELACSIDLLPTMLDVAGLEIPANVQGKSLVPLANGEAKDWRRYAFSEIGANVDNQVVTVTNTAGKYVRFKSGGEIEYEQLFDLVKDPWEMTNLAKDPEYAGMLAELRGALKEWESDVETVAPVPAPRGPARTRRGAEE